MWCWASAARRPRPPGLDCAGLLEPLGAADLPGPAADGAGRAAVAVDRRLRLAASGRQRARRRRMSAAAAAALWPRRRCRAMRPALGRRRPTRPSACADPAAGGPRPGPVRRGPLRRLPARVHRRQPGRHRRRPAPPGPRGDRRRRAPTARSATDLVRRYGDFVLFKPPVRDGQPGCCGSGRACWSSSAGRRPAAARAPQAGRNRAAFADEEATAGRSSRATETFALILTQPRPTTDVEAGSSLVRALVG